MLPKDKHLIHKLRRRISLLIILSFALGYWIRLNYYDLETKTLELEDLQHQLLENQKELKVFKSRLETPKIENTNKIEKKKVKNIINTKKVETKKDTIIPQKVDTVKSIPQVNDTIN